MDKCPFEGGRIDRLPTRPRNEVKVSGGGGGSLESKGCSKKNLTNLS